MPHPGLTRRSLIAAGVASSALVGCAPMLGRKVSDYGCRLRMALVIDGRSRVIESVRRFETWEHYSWVPTANPSFGFHHGQATPIDIGARTLFVTMLGYQQFNGMRMSHYGDGPREPTGVWSPDQVYRDRGVADPPDWSEPRPGLSLDLAPHELPVLVTFEDVADPWSIRLVRPEALPAVFPNVRFGRSSVEWTRARATRTDVRERLPWAYRDRQAPSIAPYVEANRTMFGD